MTTVKQYIAKEIDLLTKFCNLLSNDEIKSKLPDSVNKAVKQYSKVVNGINYFKFSYVIHKNTEPVKEQILRHQDELFIQPRPLIPSIDLTEVHYALKDTEYINIFWDVLAQLTVISAIISEELEKNKKKNDVDEIDNKMKELKLEASNVSLSSMVDTVNNEYEDSALLNFIKDIDTENASITDVLMNVVKKIDISAEIDKLDDKSMNEINNVVKDFFGDDKTDFSFIVKDISKSLKDTDITKGNISDNLQSIAENITEKMMKNKDEETLKSMAMNAQGIMKNYDPNKDMMSNVEAIMKSKFGKGFNGMDKGMIEQAIKSMGLSGAMGANSRKIRRMAERAEAKKVVNNPHGQARVNSRQAAMKARYMENKKKEEMKKNEKKQ